MEVILGLGSNCPYKGKGSVELLSIAVKLLSDFVSDIRISSVYETKPMYVLSQDNFFNAVLRGNVSEKLSPLALLEKIHQVEASLGRDRSKEIRFGPRTIDIDIEKLGNLQMDTEILTIPHPRIKERAFVLIPLLEILSESADEKIREKCRVWLSELPDEGVVKSPEQMQLLFSNWKEADCSL